MRVRRFLHGLKMSVPVMLGFIPVAIAFAIMASSASMTRGESIAMSVMVFAGASQMMAVGMIAEGAGYAAVVIATFIMNLRHFIMSTCVFGRMKKTGILSKLFMSFGVTDESFAIFTTTDKKDCEKWYFIGIFLGTYSSWIIGTVIGTFLNDVLPLAVTNSLGIALYAMFIALLVPNVRGILRLLAVVAVTALINWFLRSFISPSWALVVSTLAGAGIGMFIVKDNSTDDEEVAE